jgi:protein tyrosine/serine phosphatase
MAERVPNLAGLDNVGRVAPGLYRGNAPTEQGLDTLKAMGIRTVVNLRHYHGAREERGCRERGLNYVHIVVASSDAPSDEDVTRFLKIATDPVQQPVYFHCWRGKDRTGVFCAAYRMAVDGWTREEAIGEMEAFGFFQGWRDLREYVVGFPERLDRVWPRPAAS